MPTKDKTDLCFYLINRETGEKTPITDLQNVSLKEAEETLRLYYFERVVHCRFCINNKANTDGIAENWCYKFGYECDSDDYCSHGELVDMNGET